MLRQTCLLLVCLLFAAVECAPTSPLRRMGRELKAPSCSRIYHGTDWYGGDIYGTPIKDLGSAGTCCHRCGLDSRCVGYIYRKDKDHCWLKKVINSPSPCEACAGRHENEQNVVGCSAIYGKDRFGGDFSGGPITGVISPSACCTRCRHKSGCKAWTWRREHHHCWLKHKVGGLSNCAACVTGKP